jgi:hypothetical protein
MSADPQQMQQMLAMYKQLYGPGAQAQQSLAQGAPPGTNRTAGGVNGAAQLIVALMRAQQQKKLMQQIQGQQPQTPTPSQGITPSAPTATGPGGDIGVPTQ